VPRRTEITEWAADLEDEDLIEREDMVVTVTRRLDQAHRPVGVPSQRRGRQGPVSHGDQGGGRRHALFVAEHPHAAAVLHDRRHGLQAQVLAGLPLAGRHAKGKALVNLLPIETA
jgi:DNA gyrase subunit A